MRRDAEDSAKFKAEVRVLDVTAMFEFPPLEPRREDNNSGSDSTRALEIACAKELLSSRETG